MYHKIITKKNSVKVVADNNYYENLNNKVLFKLKDTENGFIGKFYPMHSSEQASYICLDYSEAEILRTALNAMHEKETTE